MRRHDAYPRGGPTLRQRLARPLRGALSLCVVAGNTVVWCIPLYVAILAKLVLPSRARPAVSRLLVWLAEGWIGGNNLALRLIHRIRWDVKGLAGLDPGASYLVLCNHRSWVDITVLQRVFNRRIPFLRFFIKQELLWVPLLGGAWWALDYPFMKRHPQARRQQRPELANEDLERTRRACERFRRVPVALLNFLEGTRFTPEKRMRQGSPYRHLLNAKSGGMALTLAALGRQLSSILDVTIAYPDGRCGFWDLLTGRITRVSVWVRKLPIPPEFLSGDYRQDADFRDRVQAWVRAVWQEKDVLLARCLEGPPPVSEAPGSG
ncbi:MAG: acyltransferase [Deltaproteobacteria bacterium]|nr:acyltransferase [Deltaproteobacteria bacterium]